MKLGCPHCSASFDVAEERAADPSKSITCPECLEVFPVGQAERGAALGSGSGSDPVDDDDFGFELDGLSRAGLSQIGFEEGGFRSAEASRIQLSGVLRDIATGVGFEKSQPDSVGEVSSLKDVDLTLAGTYHRTGRKLHHATDVVWTGRGKAPAPTALPPLKVVPTAPPPSSVGAPPSAPKGAAHATGRTIHPPSADFEADFDDFPPLEGSLTGEGPGGGLGSGSASGFSNPGFGSAVRPRAPQSINDEGSAFGFDLSAPSDRSRKSSPPLDFERSTSLGSGNSLAGRSQAGSLEEMDFSSLLEESLSREGSFAAVSNPFADVGLAEQSVVAARGPAPKAPVAEPSTPPGPLPNTSRAQSRDVSSFFVEAPKASRASAAAAPVNEPAEGGAFDLDLPGEPPKPTLAKAEARPAKTPVRKEAAKGARPGSNKGPVFAFVALLVIGGAGVAGELLGHGYFFVGLLGDAPTETTMPGGVADKPAPSRDPGSPGVPPEPEKDSLPPLGDSPQSYDARAAALEMAVAAESDEKKKAAIQDEQVRIELQYRFRWPGRFQRDETRKASLDKHFAAMKTRSFLSQFWELLGETGTVETSREKLLEQAELALAQANTADLTGGRDLLYKALLFRERQKSEQALQLLDTVVTEQPALIWAQLERAAALREQKKFEDAIAAAEAALAVDDKNYDARVGIAGILVEKQDEAGYVRARELAEAAQASAKDAGDGYGEFAANLLRAQVYGLQGKNEDRRSALEAAAAFEPKDETLIVELAEADQRVGNAAKAAERLGACPQDVCKSLEFMRAYVRVLKSVDNMQDAEAVTERAELAFPGNPEVLFMSGDVLEARGKLSLAAKKFEVVKQKDPKYLEAYLRLAQIHRREKDYERALTVLDEASKAFESAGEESEAAMSVALERGELLMKQGRVDEAKEVFQRIVKAQPSNVNARASLARLLVEVGQPAQAVSQFEKLSEQGKGGPEISLAFAEALIQSGKPDRAIEELKTFLETNPKELEGLVKLGHAYVQKGRYEEAMAVLEHAVAINKNYAPAYFFAGLAEFGRQRRKADDVERRAKAGETVRDADKPDFEKAIIAFTSARDRDPENLQYREMLARSLTESGKKRDLLAALEQYDTVIAGYRKVALATGPKRPPSAEVYYSRGILASKLGRPREEVLKNFQDALLLDSERADYIARYGEELYRLQTRQQLDDKYVLEAKAYFTFVIDQFSKTHIRSNYYLGKIALLEWSRIPSRTPSDPLHKLALEYFQTVVAAGGDNEFPDVLFQIANIFRESEAYRLANQYYDKYLAQHRKVTGRPAPNERYVRELMRSSP